MTLTQWLAIGFIVFVVATPFIGRLLHNLRTKREFEGHLARSRECARLEKALLSDLMEHTPLVGYSLRGNTGGHTLRFTEGSLEFKPFPKKEIVAPAKKVRTARRRRPR